MRRGVVGLALAVGLVAFVAGSGVGTSSPQPPRRSRDEVARHLIRIGAAQLMTSPAQKVVGMTANRRFVFSADRPEIRPVRIPRAPSPAAEIAKLAPSFTNVRVNDPSADSHQVDQTTQNETAVAAAGPNVVVGFNDSQNTPLVFEAASDLTGYAYSNDAGASFTDGGVIPNAREFNNIGDPWLASDRDGNFYYSTLAVDAFNFNLDIGVAKSTDGGRTFSAAAPVYRPPFEVFYFGDKDAIAAGPDPTVKSRDNVYVTWDDFSFDSRTGELSTGLPVARSTDGGRTWSLAYADKFSLDFETCSFQQYVGAVPAVDRADGVLYVAAEKVSVDDPDCTGEAPVTFSEWIFRSTDGGKTFSRGVRIARVTPAAPNLFGVLELGPGSYMRLLEFPSIAVTGGVVYVAWNDGGKGSHIHLRLAASRDGGETWSTRFVTGGSADEVQPALSADSSGLYLLFYQRNPDNTLDVMVMTSTDGLRFSRRRVTTQSFPGVITDPPFDPIIAFFYMGDYIANTSDGTHRYFAWGDNRDRVTNFLWPEGRDDPDVYFAKG